MYRHGPTCVQGRVGRSRRWWVLETSERSSARSNEVVQDGPVTATEEVRHELVARVRQEIAEGTYDTEERWEAALDRLCERLERE